MRFIKELMAHEPVKWCICFKKRSWINGGLILYLECLRKSYRGNMKHEKRSTNPTDNFFSD